MVMAKMSNENAFPVDQKVLDYVNLLVSDQSQFCDRLRQQIEERGKRLAASSDYQFELGLLRGMLYVQRHLEEKNFLSK